MLQIYGLFIATNKATLALLLYLLQFSGLNLQHFRKHMIKAVCCLCRLQLKIKNITCNKFTIEIDKISVIFNKLDYNYLNA